MSCLFVYFYSLQRYFQCFKFSQHLRRLLQKSWHDLMRSFQDLFEIFQDSFFLLRKFFEGCFIPELKQVSDSDVYEKYKVFN